MMLILNFLVVGLLAGLYGSYLIQYLPQRIIREEQEQIENLQSSLNRQIPLQAEIKP